MSGRDGSYQLEPKVAGLEIGVSRKQREEVARCSDVVSDELGHETRVSERLDAARERWDVSHDRRELRLALLQLLAQLERGT